MPRRLTQAFLLALFLLAGAELVGRVFFARSLGGRFSYGFDQTSGFETKGDRIDLVRSGGRKFRPQSFTQKRPDGVFRIMVVGDSVARGATLETAYPAQIADALAKDGLKAECWNLAMGGYGSRRKQIVMERALEYEPSLIVLHVNTSNEYEDDREYKRSKEFDGWHPKNWLMKSLIIRRIYEAKTESLYWKWLPQEIRVQNMVSDADAEMAASLDKHKEAQWTARVQKVTADCVALARSKGVPILLVVQAYGFKDEQGRLRIDDQGLTEQLRPLADASTHVFSMRDALAKEDFKSLYADTSHLHAPGHQILARKIVAQLKREAVLKNTAK